MARVSVPGRPPLPRLFLAWMRGVPRPGTTPVPGCLLAVPSGTHQLPQKTPQGNPDAKPSPIATCAGEIAAGLTAEEAEFPVMSQEEVEEAQKMANHSGRRREWYDDQ